VRQKPAPLLASSFDADLDTMLLDDDGLAAASNNPREAEVQSPIKYIKRRWYFKQDTREWLHADIDSQEWWAKRRAERKRLIVQLSPDKVVESLHAAKAAGRQETWGCDVSGKPGEILRDLQQAADRGSEVYVSLSQRPTFFLHDVVIPAISDWVAIEAKNSWG
jgi:hypothetical protein